jgi:SagB-type dehydrogenase family enzyme
MSGLLPAPSPGAGMGRAAALNPATPLGAYRECVEGQEARFLPFPARSYLPAHIHALMHPGSPRRIVDLCLGCSDERGWRSLALASSAARLRARRLAATGLGAGASWEEAVVDGVYDVLTVAARGRLAAGGEEAILLTDWRAAVQAPGSRRILEALADLEAELDLHLFEPALAVPVVGASLRLSRAPRLLQALACDLDLEGAITSLLERLLRGFYLFGLLTRSSGRRLPTAFERDALDGGCEGCFRVRGQACWAIPTPVTARERLETLKGRLHEAGLRMFARQLHPAPPRSDTAPGVRIVQVRLLPSPAAGAEPDSGWRHPEPGECELVMPEPADLLQDAASVPLSRLYHENSKLRQLYRVPGSFPSHDFPLEIKKVLGGGAKDYSHAALEYQLPLDRRARTVPIEDCLRRRRSVAPMAPAPIPVAQLGHLLHFSYGVTAVMRSPDAGLRQPLRAAPSGGSLYPIDMYLLLDRVEGIERGIYYYHPLRHRLQLVRRDYDLGLVSANTGYGKRVEESAAVIMFVGALRRNQWKYGERGYRILHLDCGHLAQNLLLLSSSLGLVAHPIMGFSDDYFNDLLHLDGQDEVVLYLTLLGQGVAGPAPGQGGTAS